MWLINTTTIKLQWFDDTDLPYYAILSHTWGKEEISLQEMESPTPETFSKLGYQKITGACSLTKKRYLEWIWIDTCCIDKKSSAELSEAINSMYRYYQEATTCYVYLNDVEAGSGFGDGQTTFELWAGSKWWRRGWTLQELIAPVQVYFFASDWRYLGTKELNAEEISRATKIPVVVLKGVSPTKYSIAQRISWSSNRDTTRKEDMAYCLLGLLEVNMPLLYGEGTKAFIRLQEEVIKISADQSIFAWQIPEEFFDPISYRVGMLAESPAWFAECENRDVVFDSSHSYAMTNLGLNIRVLMGCCNTVYGPLHFGVLRGEEFSNPHDEEDTKKRIKVSPSMLLQHVSANRYARVVLDEAEWEVLETASLSETTITVAQRFESIGHLSLACGFLYTVAEGDLITRDYERNIFVFSSDPEIHSRFYGSKAFTQRQRGPFSTLFAPCPRPLPDRGDTMGAVALDVARIVYSKTHPNMMLVFEFSLTKDEPGGSVQLEARWLIARRSEVLPSKDSGIEDTAIPHLATHHHLSVLVRMSRDPPAPYYRRPSASAYHGRLVLPTDGSTVWLNMKEHRLTDPDSQWDIEIGLRYWPDVLDNRLFLVVGFETKSTRIDTPAIRPEIIR
jgi:hypothetical protein